MSATMARQEGRVQLEQSNMCLAQNKAEMAKEGFSWAAIEETKYPIKEFRAKVQEKKKQGVEFPAHETMYAMIERHPAMIRQNHMAGCLPCQKGTPKNPRTCWRCKGTGAPPPDWRRQPTSKPMPHLPRMPPMPTSNISRAEHSQIFNLLAGYAYWHSSLACAEWFSLDASDQNSKHEEDFDPDMLTDQGISTG
jgi:hypothetical protein